VLPQSLLLNSDEPSLADRLHSSNGRIALNGTRTKSKAGLVNGGDAVEDVEDDDADEDHELDLPNGCGRLHQANGSKSSSRLVNDATAAENGGDDVAPYPLPPAVAGNPLASSPALSHALNQALHSADRALLSLILAHSDPLLVRATVQRLSGNRALVLLEQLVARLVGGGSGGSSAGGKGGRTGSGGGSASNPNGGGASAGGGAANDALARGTSTGKVRTTIEWIRAILLIHTTYLMALPHLTSRLASLHMALSARLASHNRLVALQGRLDLVLSQIEMRAAYVAAAGKVGSGGSGAAQAPQGVSSRLAGANAKARSSKKAGGVVGANGAKDPTRWVEPSDEEEDEDEDVEGEMDVDGRADKDSDDEENEEDDEDEDDDDDDISSVQSAEELEDDSDVEDIMLGSSRRSSRRRNMVFAVDDDDDDDNDANGANLSVLDDDDEDAGDTTADSGDEYSGTAALLRARALAARRDQASRADYAAGEAGNDAEPKPSTRGKRGKGASAAATAATDAAPAASGKDKKAKAKAKEDEMDVDEDEEEDDEDEDDESLLDEEGDSELEDDDEEDDEDHADYGMADMEAESTDGDGEEDDDDEEEE